LSGKTINLPVESASCLTAATVGRLEIEVLKIGLGVSKPGDDTTPLDPGARIGVPVRPFPR
jgi:hypothetical protein